MRIDCHEKIKERALAFGTSERGARALLLSSLFLTHSSGFGCKLKNRFCKLFANLNAY